MEFSFHPSALDRSVSEILLDLQSSLTLSNIDKSTFLSTSRKILTFLLIKGLRKINRYVNIILVRGIVKDFVAKSVNKINYKRRWGMLKTLISSLLTGLI